MTSARRLKDDARKDTDMRLPSRLDQSFTLPESTLDKVANVLMIGLLVALLLSIAAGLMLF